MQFHAVEASVVGILGCLPVVGHYPGDLTSPEDARLVKGHHALLVGIDLTPGGNGRGRHGVAARGFIEVARHPADMHQLGDYFATGGVDRRGHPGPGGDLGVVEQSRRATVTQAAGTRRDPLRNDQAGTGALGVVIDHHVRRHGVAVSPAASHRRHHHTVLQL